jgi:hypothetical protein
LSCRTHGRLSWSTMCQSRKGMIINRNTGPSTSRLITRARRTGAGDTDQIVRPFEMRSIVKSALISRPFIWAWRTGAINMCTKRCDLNSWRLGDCQWASKCCDLNSWRLGDCQWASSIDPNPFESLHHRITKLSTLNYEFQTLRRVFVGTKHIHDAISVDELWAEKRGIGKVEYDEMRCSVPKTAVRYSKQTLGTSPIPQDQNFPIETCFR